MTKSPPANIDLRCKLRYNNPPRHLNPSARMVLCHYTRLYLGRWLHHNQVLFRRHNKNSPDIVYMTKSPPVNIAPHCKLRYNNPPHHLNPPVIMVSYHRMRLYLGRCSHRNQVVFRRHNKNLPDRLRIPILRLVNIVPKNKSQYNNPPRHLNLLVIIVLCHYTRLYLGRCSHRNQVVFRRHNKNSLDRLYTPILRLVNIVPKNKLRYNNHPHHLNQPVITVLCHCILLYPGLRWRYIQMFRPGNKNSLDIVYKRMHPRLNIHPPNK